MTFFFGGRRSGTTLRHQLRRHAPGFGVGHVVDFLQIPLLPAIFNLADVAIVSSMLLFLILTLRGIGLDGRHGADEEEIAEDDTDVADQPAADQPAADQHDKPQS